MRKDHGTPSIVHSVFAVHDYLTDDCNVEPCCICFDKVCAIGIQECGYRLCAHCTLALCCDNQPIPNPLTSGFLAEGPVCSFCRSRITKFVLVYNKTENDVELLDDSSPPKPRKFP